MQNITVAVNPEEWDRLNRILRPNQTVYGFAKDAILERIRLAEEELPKEGVVIRPIVKLMVEALRDRKWTLYQMQDFSDRNHKEWLSGRFRSATKSEIADAIALFRTKVE